MDQYNKSIIDGIIIGNDTIPDISFFETMLDNEEIQLFNKQSAQLLNRWYRNGVKKLPKDLIITSAFLFFWLALSGHNGLCDETQRCYIKLQTNKLSKNDVEKLRKMLCTFFKSRDVIVENDSIIKIKSNIHSKFIEMCKQINIVHSMYEQKLKTIQI